MQKLLKHRRVCAVRTLAEFRQTISVSDDQIWFSSKSVFLENGVACSRSAGETQGGEVEIKREIM